MKLIFCMGKGRDDPAGKLLEAARHSGREVPASIVVCSGFNLVGASTNREARSLNARAFRVRTVAFMVSGGGQ